MKYFFDPLVGVRAFEDDGSQDHLITEEMRPLTQEEIAAHLSPIPLTYQSELAALNAAYQLKVDGYNRAFAISALVDGASEEAKKLAIRADYETAKAQNAIDRAALKTKYGL